MIVERDAAHIFHQSATQRDEISFRLVVETQDDQAWHRQLIEIEAGAEPWFEQALGFFACINFHRRNAGRRAGNIGGTGNFLINHTASDGAHLNGHFARNSALPF